VAHIAIEEGIPGILGPIKFRAAGDYNGLLRSWFSVHWRHKRSPRYDIAKRNSRLDADESRFCARVGLFFSTSLIVATVTPLRVRSRRTQRNL